MGGKVLGTPQVPPECSHHSHLFLYFFWGSKSILGVGSQTGSSKPCYRSCSLDCTSGGGCDGMFGQERQSGWMVLSLIKKHYWKVN